MKYDYLVVGAGYAGCVLAERLSSQRDKKILLIDRRDHIGGNAFDSLNEHGIRIHHYGPHLFHTNSEKVVAYLSQFTEWHPYEHRVRSFVNGTLVPMPINRTTVNQLLGQSFRTEEEVLRFFEREKETRAEVNTSEDLVVSKVGRRLYELLYRGYTRKHWGREPSLLAPSVCGRLPVRTNEDDRYFDDTFQAMPMNGYAAMFSAMVAQRNIHIELRTQFSDIPPHTFDRLIFTGPIDEFFGHHFGRLAYRSLRFEFETHDKEFVQPVAQINYPNDFEYTRTTEFKHITGQQNPKTTVAKEFPLDEGEPYYPVPQKEYLELYQRYLAEAKKLSAAFFVGRLATYQYYNMDQVVAQALALFEKLAVSH